MPKPDGFGAVESSGAVSTAGRPVMPAAFFGHGSPTNTIATNRYTTAWRAFGATLPLPRAILVVSAHWFVPGTKIGASRRPPTIHDFNSGFPPGLFAFTYPARGDQELVERVIDLVRPIPVQRDETTWGLDHGAYCILAHAFPDAAIPVVELSIDRAKAPGYHYDLAARLAPLRDEGVFIMTSGNVVHNLELGDPTPGAAAYEWGLRFDRQVHDLLAAREHGALVDYHRLGSDARLSVPTPEHYLPLLYTIALQRANERISPIVEGFDFRAASMFSFSIAP
jgi:4,5-DOPA dioxygenase extradiol